MSSPAGYRAPVCSIRGIGGAHGARRPCSPSPPRRCPTTTGRSPCRDAGRRSSARRTSMRRTGRSPRGEPGAGAERCSAIGACISRPWPRGRCDPPGRRRPGRAVRAASVEDYPDGGCGRSRSTADPARQRPPPQPAVHLLAAMDHISRSRSWARSSGSRGSLAAVYEGEPPLCSAPPIPSDSMQQSRRRSPVARTSVSLLCSMPAFGVP
jgi:hypothetical protein